MENKAVLELENQFLENYKIKPTLRVNAPARANIIGEHTDYNKGLVLPFAINRTCIFLASKRDDTKAFIGSIDLNKSTEININSLPTKDLKDWRRYFILALEALKRHNYILGGFQCVFASEIPIGAGLSSSSAITCGFIAMLDSLFSLNISKEKQVRLASEAENGTGLQGGMMDQYSIVMSEENHALLLDCRDFSTQLIPNSIEGYHWVFIDSQVKHNLADTEYNARRNDCDEGFKIIQKKYPNLKSIRDLTLTHLNILSDYPIYKKRLQFVIKENERVRLMAEALKEQDVQKITKLLFEGHWALSTEYQVSCEELDFLVQIAETTKGVNGARMMGGGFGGGIITLIENSSENTPQEILSVYKEKYGKGAVYNLKSIEGVSVEQLVEN